MKIAGIICEYNPFHNGHKYQIELAKKTHGAVVCIMSGSFVQRGDAAIYDKWTRAHAALCSGADLIIELPVRYCLSSAQGFARGAVETLDAAGIIDTLFFGSESENLQKLLHAADVMLHEPASVSAEIKRLAAEGMGFAAARECAYDGLIDSSLLSYPNNLLAVEYICSLMRIGSKISPVTHGRTVGYHDSGHDGAYASATLVREKIKSSEDFSHFVPYDYSGHEKYDINRLSDIFRYRMITEKEQLFCGIPDIEPGLDNRFLKSAHCRTIDETVDFVSSKRHTKSRIRRILASSLLNLRGGYRPPEYIRVLGMNETGREILGTMRKTCSLPVINKTADFDTPMLREDILAANVAALCADKTVPQNRDFLTSPVVIKAACE